MKLTTGLICVALIIPPLAFGAYPSSPKAVVEKYLQLDADAAGLSETTWSEVGEYVTWLKPPPWETFMVIDRYEITRAIEGSTRAQVRVTYHPLGRLSDRFVAESTLEPVVFYLNKINGQWKIDSPMLMPHVSWAVMKQRLEAKSAANPKVKQANDLLLNQIIAARQGIK